MGVSWINYNNKKVLFCDYSGIKTTEGMLSTLHEYTDILRNSEGNIECLENYADSYATKNFVNEGNRLGKEVHVHKIRRNALLGVEGIKKILYAAYIRFSNQKNVRLFKDREEALDWLTEE